MDDALPELVRLVKKRHELEAQICKRAHEGGRCGPLINWLDDARAAEREWIEAYGAHEAVRADSVQEQIEAYKASCEEYRRSMLLYGEAFIHDGKVIDPDRVSLPPTGEVTMMHTDADGNRRMLPPTPPTEETK